MTINQAKFKINGTPSADPTTGNRGYDAVNSENLELTLEINPSSVLGLRYEVYSDSDPTSPLASKDAPAIVFVGSGTYQQDMTGNINGTAEIQMPSSGVHSYIIRAVAVTPDGEHVYERIVSILYTATTPDLRKTIPAETNQYRERSWSDDFNDMLDAMGALISASFNMDETYNIFGANPAIVTIDSGEGQGSLVFMPTGANSFDVDLADTTGSADGFRVYDGGNYWNLLRVDDESLSIDANLTDVTYGLSGAFNLFAAVESWLVVSESDQDLYFGARGETIPLNELGEESLDGAFTAISVVGCLNELITGLGTHTDLDEAYDNFGIAARTITMDAGTITWDVTGAYDFYVYLNNASDTYGFVVEHYIPPNGSTTGFYLLENAGGVSLTSNLKTFSLIGVGPSEIYVQTGNLDIYTGTGAILLRPATSLGVGTAAPSSFVDIEKAGTATSDVDFLEITNTRTAASMTNTRTSILFNQYYYDISSPNVADSAKITVGTEGNWTSTGSTQNSYMAFCTALAGTVAEKMRITSGGNVGINGLTSFGTSAAGVLGIASGTAPSTSPVDAAQFWVADRGAVAGKAGLHGRSEDGTSFVFSDMFGLGTVLPSSFVDVEKAGTTTSDVNFLELTNTANAAAMTDTRTSILFNQFYYDLATPAVADAAKITVGTEGNWDSTASNQDAYMSFSTALDGAVGEKLRITSGGNIGINTTTFGTSSVGEICIANGTAPSASVANAIQIFSTDSSDNTATLGLFLEQAIEDIGTFTGSHKVKVKINGTEYWLQLDAV